MAITIRSYLRARIAFKMHSTQLAWERGLRAIKRTAPSLYSAAANVNYRAALSRPLDREPKAEAFHVRIARKFDFPPRDILMQPYRTGEKFFNYSRVPFFFFIAFPLCFSTLGILTWWLIVRTRQLPFQECFPALKSPFRGKTEIARCLC